MKTVRRSALVIFLLIFITANFAKSQYQIENLDRGLVAVKLNDTSIFLSWRLLASDPNSISFNVYRGDVKLNDVPLATKTNFIDRNGSISETYNVVSVLGGVEQNSSDTVTPWSQNYLSIPLQIPTGGTTPDNVSYTYNANDCSTGDLDGDGKYDIILKWDPSNSKDNSQDGYTGNVYLDGYKLDGTRLWRIDLGINIRAGAHYTQFMVYDLDGDGKAEVACKTAPGTKDGIGNLISKGPAATADHSADYRNGSGYILSGPEYFTVFDGVTGEELATANYDPPRGNLSTWGDTYGNRVDRFLASIAYLDGERPSAVMCRGYYTGNGQGRTVLAAWDYRNDTLTQRWTFSASATGANAAYTGQGNHNLSVGDVDDDGKDEIIYGSCAIDDDGTGLWTTGLGHGDAMHLSDINPNRQGLEVWGIHEGAGTPGSALLDAKTGEVIWKTPNADVGRGVAADLVLSSPGIEVWGGTDGLRSPTDVKVGNAPGSSNHVIWWDGDMARELLNDNYIQKYGGANLLVASGCASNNGTKSNPGLQADLFGDWREEVIFRTTSNNALRIYTTTDTSSFRITTFMHDHVYRLGVAWQNVAYNQPPHTGFYLSPEILLPDSIRPPAPPSNFTATALNDTVKLNWNDNFEADLEGYNLYRSTSESGEYTKLNFELLVESSYVDSVVENDTAYYYKVTAVDTLNNESRFLDPVKAIPTIRPDFPTGVYARNDHLKIKLFWNANTTDTISGYNVYRSTTSGKGYTKVNSALITQTEYLNMSLTNGVTYYFVVTSVDNKSKESFYSDEVVSTAGTVTYLQENEGIISGGSVDNNNLGFNGAGFLNFGATGYVEFINIGGNTGGNYMLVYRYALGSSDRTGSLIVNESSQSLTMKATTAWTNYITDSVIIHLTGGFTNTIRFASTGGDFGNLDEIIVKPTNLSDIYENGTELTGINGNYPNPFSENTIIQYFTEKPGMIQVQILNILGQPVNLLVNSHHEPGTYNVSWNGTDGSGKIVPGGIYFYRLVVNNKVYGIKKMILTEN